MKIHLLLLFCIVTGSTTNAHAAPNKVRSQAPARTIDYVPPERVVYREEVAPVVVTYPSTLERFVKAEELCTKLASYEFTKNQMIFIKGCIAGKLTE